MKEITKEKMILDNPEFDYLYKQINQFTDEKIIEKIEYFKEDIFDFRKELEISHQILLAIATERALPINQIIVANPLKSSEKNLNTIKLQEYPTLEEFKLKAKENKNKGKFNSLGQSLNALAREYGYKEYRAIKPILEKNKQICIGKTEDKKFQWNPNESIGEPHQLLSGGEGKNEKIIGLQFYTYDLDDEDYNILLNLTHSFRWVFRELNISIGVINQTKKTLKKQVDHRELIKIEKQFAHIYSQKLDEIIEIFNDKNSIIYMKLKKNFDSLDSQSKIKFIHMVDEINTEHIKAIQLKKILITLKKDYR